MLTSILAFSATETCLFCEREGKKATKEDPKGGEGQPRAADGRGITQGVTPALPPFTKSPAVSQPDLWNLQHCSQHLLNTWEVLWLW